MVSWTLSTIQNIAILEAVKILTGCLVTYMLMLIWSYTSDDISKIWRDMYLVEQILSVISHKRVFSILTRVFSLICLLFLSFFATLITKWGTNNIIISNTSPVNITLDHSLNSTITPFNVQMIKQYDYDFSMALCNLFNTCSPIMIQGDYVTPVQIPVKFTDERIDVKFNLTKPNTVLTWNLIELCSGGTVVSPNSTSYVNNTYTANFISHQDPAVNSMPNDLNCYISDIYTNNVYLSSTTMLRMISNIPGYNFVTISSETFYQNNTAIKLDIVSTSQIYNIGYNQHKYNTTSKYMWDECVLLLNNVMDSNKNYNYTSFLTIEQYSYGIELDACSTMMPTESNANGYMWTHIIINTTSTINQDNVDISSDLPFIGMGGYPSISSKLPSSNLMLLDYTIVPYTQDNITLLDGIIDDYVYTLTNLKYNYDSVWNIKMGNIIMLVTQYSTTNAILADISYIIIVIVFATLGVISIVLTRITLIPYYRDSIANHVFVAKQE